MGKIKVSKKDLPTKQEHFNDIKNGYVNKKKFPKYKNTPTGKVPVISNTKQQNKKKDNITLGLSPNNKGKLSDQKSNAKKNQNVSPQKKQTNGNVSPHNGLMNKNKNNAKQKLKKQGKISKAIVEDKKNVSKESVEEDDPDFNSSDESDEEDVDDGKANDNKVRENSLTENKGVKMFAGIKPEIKKKPSTKQTDDDDSNSDSENENKSIELQPATSAEKKVRRTRNTSNESDINLSLSSTFTSEMSDDDDDEDEDEDEDEDDEEESDGDENNKSELGLKALLENTLMDDDDDEDFNEQSEDDEDEDISEDEEEEDNAEESDTEDVKHNEVTADKKKKKKEVAATESKTDAPKLTPEQKAEINRRTIFVGNVPKNTKKEQLAKVFSKFGSIESIRLRGIIPENPNIPLKVAAIKKQFHPKLNNIIAYIRYNSEESVQGALCMNGKLFNENYLRVDTVTERTKSKIDPEKAVFLGNLPYNIDNNSLWNHFSDCGKIDYVRVVRHRKYGACVGIAYINFKTKDAAELALELNGTVLKNKKIRVKPYSYQEQDEKKKSKKRAKRSPPTEDNQLNEVKKHKKEIDNVAQATHNSISAQRRKDEKMKKSQSDQTHGKKGSTPSPHKSTGTFQGQKGDLKLKRKGQKLNKKKKILAEKLTATSKKPMKK